MMKCLPPESIHHLDIPRVLALVSDRCQGALGKMAVEKMEPVSNSETLTPLLGRLQEFGKVFQENPPKGFYDDLFPLLKKIRMTESYLEEEEFGQMVQAMQAMNAWQHWFQKNREKFPYCFFLAENPFIEKSLLQKIQSHFNEFFQLRDDASAELLSLRRSLSKSRKQVRKRLDSIFRDARKQGYVASDTEITIRGGRLVIPVLAEYKRQVKGFIHDESATGKTVYIEPAAVLEKNNEIIELEYRERREILRILKQLTALLQPHIQSMHDGLQYLGELDLLRAKIKFMQLVDGVVPVLSDLPETRVYEARHPLLELHLTSQQRQIVPIDYHFTENQRIIILSGPNAGGKSVCLKTIGLLQYMVQCGLPVPVAEQSSFTLVNQLFIEMGDSQSLENDLSTYSSHLTHMRELLLRSDHKTLFLIDEFGSGTDPEIGGKLAESILSKLSATGSMGLVTTHYGNLKAMAEKTPAMVNAAMQFDHEKLEPLFRLDIGKPGSSFALEIARKIGLPDDILEATEDMAGTSLVHAERLAGALDQKEQELQQREKRLKKQERELKETRSVYEQLKSRLEEKQAEIVQQAKQEASRILGDANKTIEHTIRSIKEAQADKKRTREARDELKAKEKKYATKDFKKPEQTHRKTGKISVGDRVYLESSGLKGEVVGKKGNELEIRAGALKTFVHVNDVQKTSEKAKAPGNGSQAKSGSHLVRKKSIFNQQLDVRGKRADEALGEFEKFLDDALLAGASEIKILHGKGNGVLRNVIRNAARKYDVITSIEDEHIERGGSGISVLTLK